MANSVRFKATLDDQVTGKLGKMRDQFDRLGKSKGAMTVLQGVGMGMGISAWGALSSGISAAVGVLQDSVTAASDLRESMALTEQVFESNTAAVKDWAENTEDAFSTTEALNFASQFGTAFKNVGMSLDETTAKAKEMTTLAGDLGSAFNRSSEEAATALRAGLLGESEPMRRFGVFLDEAKVKAKAAAMGMEALGGKLTDGQKIAARYALIMEQTADSQGMFGRDTGSLADSQKKLQAAVVDLEAKIGEKLMPTLVELTTWATEEGIPALDGLVEAADKLGPVIDAFNSGSLTESVDGFNKASDATERWEERLLSAMDGMAAGIPVFGDGIQSLNTWMRDQAGIATDLTAEEIDLALAMDTGSERAAAFAKGMGDAATATGDVGDAAEDTRPRVKDLAKATHTAADAFEDLEKWARRTAEALTSDDLARLRLEFANAKIELQDNTDSLADMTDQIEKLGKQGKPVPSDLQRKFNDLKLKIMDNQTEVADLGIQFSNMGGIKFTALLKQLEKLGIKLDADTAKALELRSAIQFGTDYDNSTRRGGRASGGPVSAGGVYTVGEQGPETLVMGVGGGGYVIPNRGGGGGGGGGGSPVVISLQLDGREIARAVDRQLYYEAARAPQSATAG